MRIGIDGHLIGKNAGGVERYVEKVVELVPSLCPGHDFIVFVNRQAKARFADDRRGNVWFVPLPVADPLVQRSLVLPWMIRQHRLDLLQVQRLAPWANGACRIILTVHDLVPLKYPRQYSGLRNLLVRQLTAGSVRRASLILSPTKTISDEIRTYFPAVRAPLRAYYPGVDTTKFHSADRRADSAKLRSLGVTEPFIFSPGAIEPRKNLEAIVRALARLDDKSRPQLVLSGSIRSLAYWKLVQGLAQALGVAESIRYLGFVSEDDLIELYGRARICVAASIDEGFNQLPVEAMACGTPVICSDIPVHRELYEDAAKFFPPERDELLALAFEQLLTDEAMRLSLVKAAQACVARLSWDATSRKMAGYFNELATV